MDHNPEETKRTSERSSIPFLPEIFSRRKTGLFQGSSLLCLWDIPQSIEGVRLMETLEKGYVATLDSKRRLTLRGAKYKYYLVHIAPNGVVILQPQKLVPAASLSKKTLAMMDQSIASVKEGKVSEPIDLSEFLK
jgi:hypothetical protein